MNISTLVTIWRENTLGYLSADIICSEMRTVFLERSSRKTVSYEEQIMFKDKYASIFSRQMVTIVFIITHPLIFEWFYWLRYVTWCKSLDSYPPESMFVVRLFPSRKNIVSTRISTFLFSYLTWQETKLVLLSLAIVTLKSWWHLSHQSALSMSLLWSEESHE